MNRFLESFFLLNIYFVTFTSFEYRKMILLEVPFFSILRYFFIQYFTETSQTKFLGILDEFP